MTTQHQLIRERDNAVILEDLELADSFWRRLVGLQFRKTLPCNRGIWLSPCSSLHTCFMRFAIDVVMLDRDNRILGVRRSLAPWRILICMRGTRSIVETCAGELELNVGEQVRIVAKSTS